MPRKAREQRPNHEHTLYTGRRAPDSQDEFDQLGDAAHVKAAASDRSLQVERGTSSGIRVRAGFELATCATPPRLIGTASSSEGKALFPGEIELTADCRAAISPLLSELPDGAALIADYLFTPVGDGSVDVRFRLLIESAPLPEDQAVAQAIGLRGELAVCLRVLAEWYSFKPIHFEPNDTARWANARVTVRPQARLFADESPRSIGFTLSPSESADSLLLPQPAAAEPHFSSPRGFHPALLLFSTGRCTLSACIRAARGLLTPLAVHIGLRRQTLDQGKLNALQDLAQTLSAAGHGEHANTAHPLLTGLGGHAAQRAIEQLIARPECLTLFVEAAGPTDPSRAWLRILAHELFPDFVPELVSAAELQDSTAFDLSQILALGTNPPPLLPAPPQLEALSFPNHFANPTVLFPDEGLELGKAQIGGVQVDVRLPHADRSRHMYVLGATGTGKSTLLYNLIVQDMQAGRGLAVIDPHGDLFEQLLAAVPTNRVKDLVIIDPNDERFCPGLNPLDFGGTVTLSAANRVASDMLGIFEQLYDMRVAGGPGFEEYFRNSLMLAAACPASGPAAATGSRPNLLSIPHVLRDDHWRESALSQLDKVYGPVAAEQIRGFFKSAAATRGEQDFKNWVPYVTSKLTRFVTNETLRKMICSERRTLDFRAIMDQRKIVLVDLAKGDLGGPDSRLVGMLLTKYFFHAALSRTDIPRAQRKPFYCYLDEFQNFVSSDIPELLAESRKFGLHLILANQTLGQLMQEGRRATLDAVLGNVATKLILRVGLQEATLLEAGFAPHFNAHTLTQLPDRHVLSRLQIDNQPTLPIVFQTHAPAPLPKGASALKTIERVAAAMQIAASTDKAHTEQDESAAEQVAPPITDRETARRHRPRGADKQTPSTVVGVASGPQ